MHSPLQYAKEDIQTLTVITFFNFCQIPWTLLSSERMNFLTVHHLTDSPCLRCSYIVYWMCISWWYCKLSISAGIIWEASLFRPWEWTKWRLFGRKRWSSERVCHGKGRIVKNAMEKKGNGSEVMGQLPFFFLSQDRELYPSYHVEYCHHLACVIHV